MIPGVTRFKTWVCHTMSATHGSPAIGSTHVKVSEDGVPKANHQFFTSSIAHHSTCMEDNREEEHRVSRGQASPRGGSTKQGKDFAGVT